MVLAARWHGWQWVVAVPEELARQYRGRVVVGPFSPVDPAEVRALEYETGRAIPPAYRRFIEVANGGALPYSVCVPPGPPGEPVSYSDLYRLGRDEDGGYGFGTLLGEYRFLPQTVLAEHLPVATLLPIARTGGEDDTLFLDLAPDRYGQVVGFVSGLPAWTGLRTHDMAGVLADDFDAYLDSLFIEPGAAEDEWSDAAGLDPADPWRRVVERWLDLGCPAGGASPGLPGD
jgi:SMI1 / KNR4 family (SUKH-1)